ncbi:MAG: hypothetical protein Q7T25_09090, partial [Sideroxyarcus sp.]|nr:hypothetical protein [Sideroxyarcus sp.]
KIEKVKKLVEEGIAMRAAKEKTGELTEDPHVQIQKKTIQEPGHDNRIDQSGLIVKKTVQDQGIPQAQSEKKSRYGCAMPCFSQTVPSAKA